MVCPVTEDTLCVSQVTLSHTQVIVEALEGRGLLSSWEGSRWLFVARLKVLITSSAHAGVTDV